MGNAISSTVEFVVTCGSAGRDVVVIVDPISTGAVVASQATQRHKLNVISVWSESVPDELKSFVAKGLTLKYLAVIQHAEGKVKETAAAIGSDGSSSNANCLLCSTCRDCCCRR